jgi:hypothetical protein
MAKGLMYNISWTSQLEMLRVMKNPKGEMM